ncbi:MAG: TlpA family protein disulfide reductase [Flavobacterium sp.]|nr:MAG: TlpA family protein disulfide reductase [Flavobacterium sp.]
MAFIVKENKLEWKYKLKVADQFMVLNKLLDDKRADSALSYINEIKLNDDLSASSVSVSEKLDLLKASLLNEISGPKQAYEFSSVSYYKSPSKKLKDAAVKYAGLAGIDTAGIVYKLLVKYRGKLDQATGFSLYKYGVEEKVTLADLKGKVILITYWYPGCGPCRAEFPHFENVLKEFNRDSVMYLGINAYPEQDKFVEDFMKFSGVSFIPLKINKNWDPGNLAAFSYPTNFLIDKEGRLAYSKFHISEKNENLLELMIKDLLVAK